MLPIPDIDYTMYQSTSGMSTKEWGPHAWGFLFTCIMGTYPVKIDNSYAHWYIRDAFKSMLTNMSIIMPCIFCRESYKQFIYELPIDEYLVGRIELMYWLYLMKDKVNKKLIEQERLCYTDEKFILENKLEVKEITMAEYQKSMAKFQKTSFITEPTPSFKEVLDTYEDNRAQCSVKAKKCINPVKI